MRNTIIRLGLLFGLALSLTTLAGAQTTSKYKVNIPFDFAVGKKLFRAGDYAISFGGLAGSRERLIIRSEKGKNAALLVVSPSDARTDSSDSALVFNVYENRYFLAGIKTRFVSAEIPGSKSDVKMAKSGRRVELASTK